MNTAKITVYGVFYPTLKAASDAYGLDVKSVLFNMKNKNESAEKSIECLLNKKKDNK